MIENQSLLAATLYCVWTIILLGRIALLRGGLTVTGVKEGNSFAVSGDDVSPFSGRLCRAHANCYENLPAVLGIIFVAQILGLGSITDGLALWLVSARIAQSTTHIISTSNRAVRIRFGFFMVQYVILSIWCIRLMIAQLS